MDRFIAAMPGTPDADLMQCAGVAYQIDRSHIVNYDEGYYKKCAGYDGQDIAQKINAGRVVFVGRHHAGRLLDVGIGSGEFIRCRPNTFGFDVNPVAIEWLKRNDLWGRPEDFSSFSFWDVIEHVQTPEDYLRHVPLHGWAFFSLPIFDDLTRVRESKHYRPGEHLQYWTDEGFVHWMGMHGFHLQDSQAFETDAGRESIRSYAFKRFAWRR